LAAKQVLEAERDRSKVGLWLAPVGLGLLNALAAAALVLVELAQPAPSPEFPGLVSNAIASPGARAEVALFRTHLGWLRFPAPLSPHAYLFGLEYAFVAMAALQLLALIAAVRWPGGPRRWLFGPALASLALLVYPTVSTDLFSYASFGWEANLGVNPYLVPPAALPGDPFARMNDWTHIATPYGPIWTGISRVLVAASRNDPFAAAILFKLTAALAGIGLAWLAYAGAQRLTANTGLAVGALVIVGWSPILLMESAGMAHNDAVMMLPAIAGLLLVGRSDSRSIRIGLLLLAVATLIKPVALALLGLAALSRLARPGRTLMGILRDWALDALAIVALTAFAFAPYWSGGKLPHALWELERGLYFDHALHTNQLWLWAVPKLASRLGGAEWTRWINANSIELSRVIAAILTFAAVVVVFWPMRKSLSGPLRRQTWAWVAVTAAIGVIPINSHPWYTVWLLPPLAMLWAMTARPRWRAWIGPALVALFLVFLVYHAWPLRGSKVTSSVPATQPVQLMAALGGGRR
jgi:hypothetical protein